VVVCLGTLSVKSSVGVEAAHGSEGLDGVRGNRSTLCKNELINTSIDVFVESDDVRIVLQHLAGFLERAERDN